jgi:sterol desaturase/sphingolipid hydroxylase (fatty acid hydroxylase superfamily)
MNIKTPHWMGYIFQRPEMHRIHHERSKHYNNFSDLPIWDMIFGTYENPKKRDMTCGFKTERESKLIEMLRFKNVNDPYKSK